MIQNIDYCTKDYDGGAIWKSKNIILPNPVITIKLKDFRPWQKDLYKLLEDKPDDRTVIYIYDIDGGKGKTQFLNYMGVNEGSFCCDGNNKNNVFYCLREHLAENNMRVCILTYPKSIKKVNYSMVEAIKDGFIFSSKYESKTIYFGSCHLVIFSNHEPEFEDLSLDRWKIFEINDNFELINRNDKFINNKDD